MGARFRSWWQQIKRYRVAIGVVGIVLMVVIVLIIAVVWFYGTGFNGYNQVTTAHTIRGPSTGTVTRTEVYQPGKTLWDWMQLLFIPVVLAVAGFWFNHREREAAELRAEAEQAIEQQRNNANQKLAVNTEQENRLQTYLDNMSQLLLVFNLRKSEINDEVRYIARARTLTVLSQLDTFRKRIVIQFLYEANLINKNVDGNIISLEGANLDGDYPSLILRGAYLCNLDITRSNFEDTDLSEADLRNSSFDECDMSGCNLSCSILRETYIQNTNLNGADLHNADLYKANLTGSDLTNVNLSGANLSKAYLGYFSNKEFGIYGNAANLTNANLSNAILTDANLSEVNFTGANLIKAKVTEEQLAEAKSLQGATMPDGSIHP